MRGQVEKQAVEERLAANANATSVEARTRSPSVEPVQQKRERLRKRERADPNVTDTYAAAPIAQVQRIVCNLYLVQG